MSIHRRWLAVVLPLAGCTVGPDFQSPAAPNVAGYRPERLTTIAAVPGIPHGTSQQFVESLDLPAEWWRLFGSSPLNDLINRALKANPTLQAAQAALR